MSDPIHECIAELDGLLASKRLGVEAHYRMLAVVAKLRHASADRDPRSASHVEEATVHSPLPTLGVTLRGSAVATVRHPVSDSEVIATVNGLVTQMIDTLARVEGDLRGGASSLRYAAGIVHPEAVAALLTDNADRVETVLDKLIAVES